MYQSMRNNCETDLEIVTRVQEEYQYNKWGQLGLYIGKIRLLSTNPSNPKTTTNQPYCIN